MDPNNQKKRRKGAVDYANQGVGYAQNAQTLVKGGRAAITAIQVFAATWELWVLAFIVGVIVIVFVVIISSILAIFTNGSPVLAGENPGSVICASIGGTCTTATTCQSPSVQDTTGAICSSPTSAPGPAQICCVPPTTPAPDHVVPACSEVDLALKNDLNASVVRGTSWYCSGCMGLSNPPGETPTCLVAQKFWKLWDHLTYSTSFKNRLTSVAYSAQLFRDATIPVAFGYTGWPNRTQLKNASLWLANYYSSAAFWITHETTHMLQARDRSLENHFDISFFKANGDSACYIGSFIKTYGCIGCSGISPIRESMAEATALYVYNSKGTITNFKRQCPATYKWIHQSLFPDYEFN